MRSRSIFFLLLFGLGHKKNFKRRLLGWLVIALFMAWAVRLKTVEIPHWETSNAAFWRGSVHLHTQASHDSKVLLKDYVTTARQLGLDFLVVTDHNTPTLAPVCDKTLTILREVELSTSAGHLIAVRSPALLCAKPWDMPASPAAGVAQPNLLPAHEITPVGVRALGLWPAVAHPSERKRPWTGSWDGVGGLEIANLAAAARRAAGPWGPPLVPLALAAILRPEVGAAALLSRDHRALALWDAIPDPTVAGLCGVDAHGWVPLANNLRPCNVLIPKPDGQQGPPTPAVLVDALASGKTTCVTSTLGGTPAFSFGARFLARSMAPHSDEFAPGATVVAKQPLRFGAALSVPSHQQRSWRITLFRDGQQVSRADGPSLWHVTTLPGTYRVEVDVAVPSLVWGKRWTPAIYSGRIAVAAATKS